MFRLVLEVLGGEGPSEVHEFTLKERQKISIGRQDCELRLMDRSVSRKHLGFAVKDGKLLAGDLGSTGGTLHNGRALHRARAVKGDLFQIGSCTLLVKAFVAVEKPSFVRTKALPWLASRMEWLWARRPRTRRGWAVSMAAACVLVLSVRLVKPSQDYSAPENPFAPKQAGFDVNWKSVRNWVRAKTYALRREDPSKEQPVDYNRVFED